MAAITITVGNVGIGSESTATITVQAGESITQGQPVYRSSADGKYYRADANDTAAKAEVVGIAVTAASTNGYFLMVSEGSMNLGATLAKGTVYCVGATVGEIVPVADLTTNDYVTILGVASSTSLIALSITATGIQKA